MRSYYLGTPSTIVNAIRSILEILIEVIKLSSVDDGRYALI